MGEGGGGGVEGLGEEVEYSGSGLEEPVFMWQLFVAASRVTTPSYLPIAINRSSN